MLTIASRRGAMNRLGRATADPTRSRLLLSLLEQPGYPGALAEELELSRSNVLKYLSCLRGCEIIAATSEGRSTRNDIADPHLTRAMLDVVLAVDDGVECADEHCDAVLCSGSTP